MDAKAGRAPRADQPGHDAKSGAACGFCARTARRSRVDRFAGRASNYLTYFASAYAASWRLGPQDVVVSLTDPPILGLAALRAARRAGARFVFLCEDVFPEVAVLLDDFHNETVNRRSIASTGTCSGKPTPSSRSATA